MEAGGVLTAAVVVHASLGKHGVVLNLSLPDGGAVAADDDQLGCSSRRNVSALDALLTGALLTTPPDARQPYFHHRTYLSVRFQSIRSRFVHSLRQPDMT